MSNFTFVRFTKLQPLFNGLGNAYAALATINNTYMGVQNANDDIVVAQHYPTEGSNYNVVNTVGATGTDKVLLLIEDNNYLHTYDSRSTSTIILMIVAWVLLILGFVFCCCAECFGISIWRGKKHLETASGSRDGGGGGNGSGANAQRNQLNGADAINATTNGEDRSNRNDPIVEICRRCPPDYEVESLPSYTIVSGLPTYDDALEEFRKAGIILTPAVVPIIKIFESHEASAAAAAKELYSIESAQAQPVMAMANGDCNADTISMHSTTCTCGGTSTATALAAVAPHLMSSCAANQQTVVNFSLPNAGGIVGTPHTSQVIELSPDHLAALSQKRLSLQISFNNSVRRPSRSGATLRNTLLRSRAVGNTAGLGPIDAPLSGGLTPIHRSSSTLSLTNERQLLDQRLRHLHHRGSLY